MCTSLNITTSSVASLQKYQTHKLFDKGYSVSGHVADVQWKEAELNKSSTYLK